MDNNYTKATKLSIYNRDQVEKSDFCGCYYCLKIYKPKDIVEWCDGGRTALCPHCGIDSIIGSYRVVLSKEFLEDCHRYWFDRT